MREKFATWYFSQISPEQGHRHQDAVDRARRRWSVLLPPPKQENAAASPTARNSHVLLRRVPTASMKTVIVGSLAPKILKQLGKLRAPHR